MDYMNAVYEDIDLASQVDAAVLVLDFFLDPNHVIVPFFWIPEANAREREKRDHVPSLAWARDGHIEMTPGNVIDYEFIRRRIHELAEIYTIREIAFDPWNATQFSNQLHDDRFTMMDVKQGHPMMSEPCKDFEKHVIAGTLTHFGNPALTWMAGGF